VGFPYHMADKSPSNTQRGKPMAFRIFYVSADNTQLFNPPRSRRPTDRLREGWYWSELEPWGPAYPDDPDSFPFGPFKTETKAFNNAIHGVYPAVLQAWYHRLPPECKK